ncbi:MAG: serine hydrolase [Bacteroidota bacterium]
MIKILRIYFIFYLILFLSQCLQAQQAMTFPKEKWSIASPKSQGVDSLKMVDALDVLSKYCHEDGIEETLIIRNGKVIFQGDSVTKVHNVWSCSKSFTTTVLALLIEQGKCKLDDYAAKYEPLLQDNYPKVTLRQLASMTSGYSAKGGDRYDGWVSPDWSWTPYAPDVPYSEPGTIFQYWDENMMMLGRVLTQIAGKDIYSVIKEAITDKIDLGDWSWKTEKALKGIHINNGCTNVFMNATQLARMGLLFLNNGNWNGEQLLNKDWVKNATSNQVPDNFGLLADDRLLDGRGKYGYGYGVKKSFISRVFSTS